MFKSGDRVKTPGGLATVSHHYMADYQPNKIGSYVVKLDNSNSMFLTLYPANQIQAA